MKRKLSIGTWVLAMCLTCTVLLPSCEPIVVDPCKEQTDLRILRFREYCYDVTGSVSLAHPDGYAETEWMIPVETEKDISAIFQQLTDLPVHFSENYEYAYHSEDYRFVIRIVGQETPVDNKYASLYVWIEGCPEIQAIHFKGTGNH